MQEKKLNVVIVAGGIAYRQMIKDMGHEVQEIHTHAQAEEFYYCDADVVLFTGGADVNPAMYGHTKHLTTHYSERDDELYDICYNKAKEQNPDIKFVGICRGSQYLCVKAGGKLVQDLKGHAIWGTHEVTDYEGETHQVTSTHHQMQYPCDVQHKVLAWADAIAQEPQMHIDGEAVDVELPMDYEAVWYPSIKALAFQPHPEFNGAGTTLNLFRKLFNQLIVSNLYFINKK